MRPAVIVTYNSILSNKVNIIISVLNFYIQPFTFYTLTFEKLDKAHFTRLLPILNICLKSCLHFVTSANQILLLELTEVDETYLLRFQSYMERRILKETPILIIYCAYVHLHIIYY